MSDETEDKKTQEQPDNPDQEETGAEEFSETEKEAHSKGWRPLSDWEGDTKYWKPAEQFLKETPGYLKKELDRLNKEIAQSKRDSAKHIADTAKRVAEMEEKAYERAYAQAEKDILAAAEEGDIDKVKALQKQQKELKPPAKTDSRDDAQGEAPQVIRDFYERTGIQPNSWQDTIATGHAQRIRAENPGILLPDLLAEVEREMSSSSRQRRNGSGVEPGGKNPGPRNKPREGFASLPDELKKVGKEQIADGQFKDEKAFYDAVSAAYPDGIPSASA